MSELAVQSANSTYSAEQRGYLDQEFQQLKQESIRISETHEWNGFPILNGKAGEPVGIPTTTTVTRASIASDGTPKTLGANDLVLKVGADYFTIPASDSANDTKSNTFATSSNAAGSAIAIAAAINSRLKDTGVSATAIGPVISASKTNVDKTTSVQTDLFVNGTKISLSLSSSHTHAQRRQYVMDSINYSTTTHGVQASDSGSGGLTLTTVDGRNLSVWYDDTLKGYDFGLGLDKALDPDVEGVSAVANANYRCTWFPASV
jgi:flagellin